MPSLPDFGFPFAASGPAGLETAAAVVAKFSTVFEIVVLSLGLVLWLALVWRARRAVLQRLNTLAVQAARGIVSRRLRQVSARRMFQLARIGTRLASLALILCGVAVWGTLLLDALPGTHELAEDFEGRLFREVAPFAFLFLGALPNLVVVALVYFFARVANELSNHYFVSIIEGEVESALFDAVTAETTRRLADIGIWIVAVIVAFPYLPGSGSAAFRGVSVLAGLMLSLGSANLVSQFTSGLSLIYGRVLRPGDYVQTAQGEGVVERIGLLSCSLRTARDELVSLPHTVVASMLKNYSRGVGGVRFATEVTIGYDAPWRQVRELLLAAAAATPGIAPDPAPSVRQTALEDFYVRYELLFTPEKPADKLPLLGRLHEAIQDRFHAAGVQIMSPHYHRDPVAPKIPPASGF